MLELGQVKTAIVSQCTLILTCVRKKWCAQDSSKSLTEVGFKLKHLDAVTGFLWPPLSCSSMLHSCCLSTQSCESVILALPQQRIVKQCKRQRENCNHRLTLKYTYSGMHAYLQTHSNLNSWQHKDKLSGAYAISSFTDSRAQSLESERFTLIWISK